MRLEDQKLLVDMQISGQRVLDFIKGRSLTDYLADVMVRSAVERQLFIMGEAMSQLAASSPDLADRFQDKRLIVGFRNRLAHGYASLDDELVWEIASVEVAPLLSRIEELLG